MKKAILFFSVSFISSALLQAQDISKIQIKGMHCQSCVKTLTKNVCEKLNLANCEVKLTNKKEELGEMTFITPADKNLSPVKSLIEEHGYKPL